MATILTDNQHYTDIASAIRSKAGVQDLFKPSEMAAAILSIPTGGGSAVLGSKSITQNGTYYASPDSLDGFDIIDVNVDGGGSADFTALIEGTLSELYDSSASIVTSYGFYNNSSITSVSLPSCKTIHTYAFCSCFNMASLAIPSCETIGTYAFDGCSKLGAVSLPHCTEIAQYAFTYCDNLTEVYLPICESVGGSVFRNCSKLSRIELTECSRVNESTFTSCWSLAEVILSKCSIISKSAFANCSRLISLNLTGVSSVPTLNAATALQNTPVYNSSVTAGQWGSIYVPASLYDAFLAASNWSIASIAERIVSV